MDISGSHRIPAPRATVWAALSDPAILKDCLPGCERLEKTPDDQFQGAVSAKIGPIKGDFAGAVTRRAASAPERFTLEGEGDGGPAGSAKGRAEVTLREEAGETVVSYAAKADLTGKISQLGARLVTGFARKTAETFFERLAERLASASAAAPTPSVEAPLADAPPLVHEEPAEAPAVVDAPPLAYGSAALTGAGLPADPTAANVMPDAPSPETIGADEDVTPPGATNSGAITRIMLVAAIVVIAACAIYYFVWQAPPV